MAIAGSFYNPAGDPGLEKKGADAAAKLNEALASIHYMYAAYERKDAPTFERYKKTATEEISISFDLFKSVRELAGDKLISLKPRNAEEQESISLFLKETVAAFKLGPPKTQKDLANVAVIFIGNFRNVLEKTKLDTKSYDRAGLVPLFTAQVSLEEVGLAASLIWYNSR